jgi:hypothetical protein
MKFYRNRRSFVAVLFALLFAVTYWSTIPLGYMADIDQDGFKVIICDSQGPVRTLTIGADGEPIDEHDRATGNDACLMGRSLGDTPIGGQVLPIKLLRPAYVLVDNDPEKSAPQYTNVQTVTPPARAPPFLS